LARYSSARSHFEVTWLKNSRSLGSRNPARSHFKVTRLEQARLEVTSRPLSSRKLGSESLRGHLARETSARSHFEVTWPEKTGLEVTSRSGSSRKLSSKSLPDHLAQENLARIHFEVTWLEKIRLEVTSGSPGSRKLGSNHFEVTWLEIIRLEVISESLGSRNLGYQSLRGRDASRKLAAESLEVKKAQDNSTPAHLARENCSRKLFEETVQGSCHGTTELCITTLCFIQHENGYSRVHTSIYIYDHIPGTGILALCPVCPVNPTFVKWAWGPIGDVDPELGLSVAE
jgi:hypothetical protein